MRKTLLSLLMILLAASLFAQQEGAKFRKIDSLLTYLYNNNKFMGSVAVSEKGRVVFEKAYGYAEIESKMQANPKTKYKIGSITKMFTSVIIFQLIEEKKLTLNTKLSEYFPKIKNADKITISDLLNHKSGLYNYTASPDFEGYRTKIQNRRDMLGRIESYPAAFAPGEKAEYSNTNYLLLGYIIQDITKKPYKESVANRIANKAGLKSTYYFSKINPKKNEAASYAYNNSKWIRSEEWNESVAGGAGAIQSTPADLTRFAKALFDGRLIKKESLTLMTTMDMGFGKGIFTYPFIERKFFGHNGGIESFESVLGYYPKDDFGFAITLNGSDYNMDELVQGVLSCYYKLPYIFPNFKSAKIGEDVLKRYEGIYTNPALPFKVDIKLVNGVLIAHATDQGSFPLNPLSETEFNFDPAGITITFNTKGFTLKQADGTTSQFTKE
ncbi:serine hydrolase domain-containing protein [Flavobacterium sp. DG1-102-2]|uniref:serine hydrolase domain-containing protein n=1 Tax=Flavobacterium sp. DG1-102-2 TaxID=3081663 RepID=UPI002949196B|nr:serine hydrolase domain-containing protein [Flavobacterium sp. DG1-102-2]MDV6170317.1 serine hydrolase domain-containing protein [Flavobacterium sp. DG1-102-2]